jgi:hypothetical protein
MLDVKQIMDMLNRGGYFGFRGLSGIYTNKKYRLNQRMARSLDLWDDRGVEYRPGADKLNGTCAIAIDNYMTLDEIKGRIEAAKKYSDNGRVVLVFGDTRFDGADDNEIVIANADGWDYVGAKYLGEVA